jgi:hypothetical protein
MRDEDPEKASDGNLLVAVYVRHSINVGQNYSLDMSPIMGIENDLTYDGGRFGELRLEWVKMDCEHRTYAVLDARKLLSRDIWRSASTLPALQAVFHHVCGQR